MTTAIGLYPAPRHSKAGHPENPQRLKAIADILHQYDVYNRTTLVEPAIASPAQLLSVHDKQLVELVDRRCEAGSGQLDADTYYTPATYESARLAAGTVCRLAGAVVTGEASNSFALIRPPGHHAERSRVGGFCIFNNVAIAARYLQANFKIKRILIIDFDIHHGNGTQAIFYADPDILFISMHLYYPYFYPGTGWLDETGVDEGAGLTVNIPLPPGAGDVTYSRLIDEIVVPISNRFRPEYILVSAGFDGHWVDPLASAGLSLDGYSIIARKIVELANNLCSGRCTFVLEGGYHPEALSFGVLNVLNGLIDQDQLVDPIGPSPYSEPDIDSLILNLQSLHLLS